MLGLSLFALFDGVDKDGKNGDVAIYECDLPTQVDLGTVPDLHCGQSLLLEFEHPHTR